MVDKLVISKVLRSNMMFRDFYERRYFFLLESVSVLTFAFNVGCEIRRYTKLSFKLMAKMLVLLFTDLKKRFCYAVQQGFIYSPKKLLPATVLKLCIPLSD